MLSKNIPQKNLGGNIPPDRQRVLNAVEQLLDLANRHDELWPELFSLAVYLMPKSSRNRLIAEMRLVGE